MREVLARSDRDFAGAAPRRHSGSAAAAGARRLLAAALQRPGLLLGGLTIASAATAIVVNALGFQSARHPAPIFTKAERATTPARTTEPPAVLPPVPPTRPFSVNSTAALQQTPARVGSRDPIADIIRGSDLAGNASLAGRAPEPQRQVAAAQRALLKLGYGPLKTDGILGQGTRQAIERFERDRRLTPTGELGPRTARELSAQSGIRME